jgi:hypothetical protein
MHMRFECATSSVFVTHCGQRPIRQVSDVFHFPNSTAETRYAEAQTPEGVLAAEALTPCGDGAPTMLEEAYTRCFVSPLAVRRVTGASSIMQCPVHPKPLATHQSVVDPDSGPRTEVLYPNKCRLSAIYLTKSPNSAGNGQYNPAPIFDTYTQQQLRNRKASGRSHDAFLCIQGRTPLQ